MHGRMLPNPTPTKRLSETLRSIQILPRVVVAGELTRKQAIAARNCSTLLALNEIGINDLLDSSVDISFTNSRHSQSHDRALLRLSHAVRSTVFRRKLSQPNREHSAHFSAKAGTTNGSRTIELRLSGLGFPHRVNDKVEAQLIVMFAVNSVARRRIEHHFKLTLCLLQRMDQLNGILGVYVVILQPVQDQQSPLES